MDNKKIFVGNLPWSVNVDALRDLFAPFGEIVDAVVISDRMTGRSKGFGFVTFSTEEAAQAAVAQMHDKQIEERPIVVNIARPKEESRNGGGFRPQNRRQF